MSEQQRLTLNNTSVSESTEEDKIKDEELSKWLAEQQEEESKKMKVVMMGERTAGCKTLLFHILNYCSSGSTEFIKKCGEDIKFSLQFHLRELSKAILYNDDNNFYFYESGDDAAIKLAQQLKKVVEQDPSKLPTLLPAVAKLYEQHQQVLDKLVSSGCQYVLKNLARLSSAYAGSFTPTTRDLLNLHFRIFSLVEETVLADGMYFTFIYSGEQTGGKKKWMHMFAEAKLVLYCVDLESYARLNEYNESSLQQELTLMTENLNIKAFENHPVVLFFNKYDGFEKKLKTVKLSTCFKDYKGGEDAKEAIEFVMNKFKAGIKKGGREVLGVYGTALSTESLETLLAVMKSFSY